MVQSKPKSTTRSKAKAEPPLSRQRRPAAMDAADWQRVLRRQFGHQQAFVLQSLGSAAVFRDFEVFNPASGGRYRAAIRGAEPGSSSCTCPDFASNQLGTCKHIEFTLGQLFGLSPSGRRPCPAAPSPVRPGRHHGRGAA